MSKYERHTVILIKVSTEPYSAVVDTESAGPCSPKQLLAACMALLRCFSERYDIPPKEVAEAVREWTEDEA